LTWTLSKLKVRVPIQHELFKWAFFLFFLFTL
jgi:hypothetical protein